MPEMNERDTKLVQYLSEAFGKERELEAALEADIAMTVKAPYKKRLKQHLKETKGHAKQLQRRIKQLGGGTQTAKSVIGKATAAAKAPLHAVRGSGEQEKMLKNAKTQYFNEHEEIATYLAIEAFATKVGDKETAKLARGIRREEERMAKFLEGQVKSLSNAVATAEVPAKQRSASRRAPARAAKKAPSRAKAASAPKKASAKKASAKKSAGAKKAPSRKASSPKKAGRAKAKSTTRAKASKKGASKKSAPRRKAAK
jgi:ferritin-like metal-binding protein YciE